MAVLCNVRIKSVLIQTQTISEQYYGDINCDDRANLTMEDM